MKWSSQAAHSNIAAQWQKAQTQVALISDNPRGHTLGIIGLGNIGFAIAKKAKAALDMDIIYYDTVRKPDDQEHQVDATFYNNLDDMLKRSHCVLIATPAGPPVLTARTLALLPRGARVVNIARGSLIDEEALADALDSGHISAAGIDVHANEPNVNQRLSSMRNVMMTSHTGGSSLETVAEFERLAMENVERVLQGKKALTAVNTHLVPGHEGGTNGYVKREPYANGYYGNGDHTQGSS